MTKRLSLSAHTWQDLIAGGSDTSAVTLEWAMSELLRRPDIIVKAAEELDRVVGPDRLVSDPRGACKTSPTWNPS